jgi:hypothetical protein
MVPKQLKSPQPQQWNKVTDMQAVGCRVKTSIQRDRPCTGSFREFQRISAIGHQAAPLKLVHNVHEKRIEDRFAVSNLEPGR